MEDNTSVVDETFGKLMSEGKCEVIDRSIPRKERQLRQERMIKESESEVLDESIWWYILINYIYLMKEEYFSFEFNI